MIYFRVKDFEKHQHYKDRNPPWIKLYNDLLDDYEFACLQDASKLHLVMIWLLASRSDNKIPLDERWVSQKINATEKVDLELLLKNGFIEKIQEKQELQKTEQDDSAALAGRKQSAIPETEGETEAETDKYKEKLKQKEKIKKTPEPNPPDDPSLEKPKTESKKFIPPTVEQVVEYCRERRNTVDPERFVDHYTAKGWMIGKNKIKDWRACVRTWERGNGNAKHQSNNGKSYETSAERRARESEEFYDECLRTNFKPNLGGDESSLRFEMGEGARVFEADAVLVSSMAKGSGDV